METLSSDAIRFYAKEPIYFVEDVIKAIPDEKQRMIMRSLRDYPMTSVRSGHGIGKSAVEAWFRDLVDDNKAISEDSMHGPYGAPAYGRSVG